METKKSKLQNLLSNDLLKRLDELNEELEAVNLSEVEQELTSDNAELRKVQDNIDEISEKVKGTTTEVSSQLTGGGV